MKTKSASLLVVLFITFTTQLPAQKNIRVEASNEDISYALDLRAVASIFGESRNLEDFERKINDNDNEISNLDLNNDGYIDYLRVIETNENNIHLVVIQAVLGEDYYQDVASIVVERNYNNRFYVQVVGDPFLYGSNYIIEPYFSYTPYIVNWFWSPRYYRWNSPYYWGYYPRHFHYRHPLELNIYLGNIRTHIDFNNRYRYTSYRRNDATIRLHQPIGRNDFGKRNPDKNFSNRNHSEDVRNKHDFGSRNANNRVSDNNEYRQNNASDNQNKRNDNFDNRNYNNRPDDAGQNNTRNNNNTERRNNTYSAPVITDRNNSTSSNNINRNSNNETRNNNVSKPVERNKPDVQKPVLKKENNQTIRNSVPAVRKPAENTQNNSSNNKKETNSRNNERR